MSLSPSRPSYVPILLPGDREALEDTGSWEALLLSATYGVNPRTRPLCELARARARILLVDPKTAAYQFEGYMSMEDARAVPYSPGRGTLGSLWEPADLAVEPARRKLIDDALGLQRRMGADIYLAPYFLIPDVDHPWLAIAADTAREAIARGADRPVGAVVCVELDCLLRCGPQAVAAPFADLDAALYVVMVIEHDEREASPDEMRAYMSLLARLSAGGAPVLPAYCGRFGLAATVGGTVGYAGGALELETHPRRHLREGLVNLHSNSYYLPGAMIRLPPRAAEAVVRALPAALGDEPTDTRPTRMLHRARLRRALEAKRRELAQVTASGDAGDALRDRLTAALRVCHAAQAELATGPEPLRPGQFHYLEVVREMCGGAAATIPGRPW